MKNKKPNTMLLNRVDSGLTTSFTVWADCLSEISSFMSKAILLKGMPNKLVREHDVGRGYWVSITIPSAMFDSVVERIREAFKDTENIICEDFTQKDWATDMLF